MLQRWSRGGRAVTRRNARRARGGELVGWRDLLQRSQRRLDELRIVVPDPFDLDEFVGEVERVHGRPLELGTFRLLPGHECGYVIHFPQRTHDRVTFLRGIGDFSTNNNAVHELAHLIWGHSGRQVGVSAESINVSEVRTPQLLEDEADALAAVILGRGLWGSPPPGYAARHVAALAAGRVNEAFG
jgi:hypothetical protein